MTDLRKPPTGVRVSALDAVIVGIALAFVALVFASAPRASDLEDQPAYECNPGHHHTTKECQ